MSRVLNFVAGRTVDIRDAFRLGKYSTSKTRPVLVALCGVWDKATSSEQWSKVVYE